MGNTRVYSMDKSIGEINMSEITVDIGELCTHCFEDTSFGSGKRFNRIPSDADAKIVSDNADGKEIHITIDGWMCAECRLIECDKCDNLSLDPEIIPHPETGEGMVICEDCIKVDVR